MDCPACGLVNPPEAVRCDCGHDFHADTKPVTPGWQTQLTWGQNIAAYWSISWPVMAASFVLASTFVSRALDTAQGRAMFSYGAAVVFFAGQALLIPRLVRKNYRTFRVYVIGADGSRSRRLPLAGIGRAWLWIIVPQLALVLAVWLAAPIVSLSGGKMPPDLYREISSLSIWVRFLLAGPYGIDLALRAHYPGFKLQGFGVGSYKP